MRKLAFTLILLSGLGHAAMDPTRPPAAPPSHKGGGSSPASARARLEVQYILYAKDRRIARINDQMLAEGQAIEGWRLTRIDRDSVFLQRGKETRTLHIFALNAPSASDAPHDEESSQK